jgi:hypothetical protein
MIFNEEVFYMRSFLAKVVYCISLIVIVAWLGICVPAVALADTSPDTSIDDDGSIPSLPEPSLAVLTGIGIAGVAALRWLRKR